MTAVPFAACRVATHQHGQTNSNPIRMPIPTLTVHIEPPAFESNHSYTASMQTSSIVLSPAVAVGLTVGVCVFPDPVRPQIRLLTNTRV